MDHLKVKETTHQVNGLTLHTIQTTKFKTVTYYFQFRSPIKRETVTQRALLSGMLKSATQKSPTIKQLNQRLDDLYGATFSSHVQKKGNDHILSIYVHGVNDRYLSNNESVASQSLALLAEAILQPLIEGNAFNKELLNQEKRSLKSRIEALYDDKMRFASQRLIDEMCEGEPFSIHTNGYIEDLEQITPESLFEAYQTMLKEDEMDLYIVGDVTLKEMLASVQNHFTFDREAPLYRSFQPERQAAGEPKVVKESQDVEQGKLNIGYRTNIVFGDPDYYASQVFNGLFGGFPHSKLFMNVREKASLAYYATSRTESFKGLLIVMSGIEFKNYEQATAIIAEQLEKMRQGDFTELEMKQTKALLINAVLEGLDNPFSMIDLLYNRVLVKEAQSLETYADEIEKVTKEEIIQVANKVQQDTIYFLHGKEAE
ncbi:pitrilysin family protein [Pullulanibacillus sp. KACC 23026]|uniref:EF-P 5-aminopentanol modification-associated protein YfmF n=1 Tax=Pullulanibacillus sp. KACC 23026 TaxID=3028315 RepID=UPI0023AF4DD4|nr:pitrilysin family protein [Pullulanibacillus sp. KACC 23026]WEG11560.1 pitrilysin family protein [Pullulanibacillus sp. KACC 23026]